MRWTIERLGNVSSTQKLARERIAAGSGAGLVVVAESQTEGMGRRGRSWDSPPGGLYMTALLEPLDEPGLIPLLGGVVVADAIKTTANLPVGLKWPNDALIDRKKVGGVLAESGWSGDRTRYVLLGIGVNLNNPIPELLPEATSLYMELGKPVELDAFLRVFLDELARNVQRLDSDPGAIISSWKEKSVTLGKMVEVTTGSGEAISGLSVDLNPDGSLLVECDGEVRRIVSGILNIR